MIRLFAYGTLRLPQVQMALFGREVAMEPDALHGFTLDTIAIGDPDRAGAPQSYAILRRGGYPASAVPGDLLAIGEADLAVADEYEGDSYARIEVTLVSGRRAFVYVAPE